MANLTAIQSQAIESRGHDALEHQLLTTWVEAAHIGLCVIDDTTRIVVLNQAASLKFGVDGALVLNKPLKALVTAVDASASLIQWLSTPGFDGERQMTIQAGDGLRHLLLKTHSLRVPSGDRYKVIAVTDVTKLTLSLHDSEQHRRQWQALNAGVVVTDARAVDMPMIYVNPMFERMTGYTSAETIGKNCRFLQNDDSHQPGVAAIKTAIQSRTNGYAILRNYRKDGSLFLNELFISPVKDSEGEVTHFIGISHLRLGDSTPGKIE